MPLFHHPASARAHTPPATAIPALVAADASSGMPSASSTRDFLWALGTILSRGVSEDGAGGTGLVPYLDFANHGDAYSKGPSDGGGAERASCERGFDPATGSHYLRTLRDIAPGMYMYAPAQRWPRPSGIIAVLPLAHGLKSPEIGGLTILLTAYFYKKPFSYCPSAALQVFELCAHFPPGSR